jgi:hypothetical protein
MSGAQAAGMKTRMWKLAFLVTALSACGDDDPAPGVDGGDGDAAGMVDAAPMADAPPPPITLEDICDPQDGVYVELIEALFACFPEFEVFLGGLPSSSEIGAACSGSLQPYLDDGTVILGDAPSLAACRSFIQAASCESLELDDLEACDTIFIGTIALGEDCDDEAQCEGDAYCDTSGGGSCGTCAAQKNDGAACDENVECLNGLCSFDVGGNGTCRAFGAVGDDCASTDDCAGTLRCDPASSQCALEPAWFVGTPCAGGNDCDPFTSDLYCAGTGTCQAFREVGETCGPGGMNLCRIFEYQWCDMSLPTPVCMAATDAGLGEDCGYFLGARCTAGLICRDDDQDPGTNDICVVELGVGDPCDETNSYCAFLQSCVGGACQYGNYTGVCPAP